VEPGRRLANKEIQMQFFNFEIIIEKEEDDEGYFAYSPSLPGCFTNGKTIEEARQNIREALQQHVLSLREHSLPIPQPNGSSAPDKSNRTHQVLKVAGL
jgi:predicted RNase H-like HicB family nuclease